MWLFNSLKSQIKSVFFKRKLHRPEKPMFYESIDFINSIYLGHKNIRFNGNIIIM